MVRWRRDVQPLLRYATTPEAPLYREIMEIFADAAAGYASRLSPEDVHAALLARLDHGTGEGTEDVPGIAGVKERLEQLWQWGNLSQDFDTARATSLESYERTAYVYDLTPGVRLPRRPSRLTTRHFGGWGACRPLRFVRSRKCSAISSAHYAPRTWRASAFLGCARTCTPGSRA
jgi:hypothetical protein